MSIIKTFSASSVETFFDCKLKFKFRYIDRLKIKVVKDLSTCFGEAFHLLIEKFWKSNSYNKQFMLDNWVETFDTIVKQHNPLAIGSKDYTRYLNSGFPLIERFYLHQQLNDLLCESDAIEGKENLKYKEFIIIAKIDRIAKGIIIDYKTNMRTKSQEEVDKSIQLTFYSYTYRIVSGKIENGLCLHYLRNNDVIYTKRDTDDYNKLLKIIDDIAEYCDNNNEFEPKRGGDACKWCEYVSQCNEYINGNKDIAKKLEFTLGTW